MLFFVDLPCLSAVLQCFQSGINVCLQLLHSHSAPAHLRPPGSGILLISQVVPLQLGALGSATHPDDAFSGASIYQSLKEGVKGVVGVAEYQYRANLWQLAYGNAAWVADALSVPSWAARLATSCVGQQKLH